MIAVSVDVLLQKQPDSVVSSMSRYLAEQLCAIL